MKNIFEYRAIIVDLDGTLYEQRKLRIGMILKMLRSFWKWKEFLVVYKYHCLYEQGYNELQRRMHLPIHAPDIIDEWMIKQSLPLISKYKDCHLIYLLEKVMRAGSRVIVYSDYPVNEKLSALSFRPSEAYSSDDLHCMKPNPSGISRVLKQAGILPEACLVIGDRYEKDGMLADAMGADFLLLPPGQKKRKKLYKKIEVNETKHDR